MVNLYRQQLQLIIWCIKNDYRAYFPTDLMSLISRLTKALLVSCLTHKAPELLYFSMTDVVNVHDSRALFPFIPNLPMKYHGKQMLLLPRALCNTALSSLCESAFFPWPPQGDVFIFLFNFNNIINFHCPNFNNIIFHSELLFPGFSHRRLGLCSL